MDESLGKLGYELAMYNWHERPEPVIRRCADGERIGSDTDLPGTVFIGDKLKSLSYRLTDGEIKKYRWLGRETAEAAETVCRSLQPGMDEFQMEAITPPLAGLVPQEAGPPPSCAPAASDPRCS